jgi:hypothetical protein
LMAPKDLLIFSILTRIGAAPLSIAQSMMAF